MILLCQVTLWGPSWLLNLIQARCTTGQILLWVLRARNSYNLSSEKAPECWDRSQALTCKPGGWWFCLEIFSCSEMSDGAADDFWIILLVISYSLNKHLFIPLPCFSVRWNHHCKRLYLGPPCVRKMAFSTQPFHPVCFYIHKCLCIWIPEGSVTF